jgi:hypothetical protein
LLNQRLQECLKTRSEITNITVLNDANIVFSTRVHGAKIFSSTECSVSKNLSIELLGHKTTATAFSKEHRLLAFANSKIIYVVNLQNKTTIQIIHTDDGEIELLSFVENSPYLIAGTKDGRVSQYRYDGKAQLSRLCSFPHKREDAQKIKNNYVSALAFHGQYIACSGYGGSIILIKMSSLADKRAIYSSTKRINVLCFIDSETLLSGDVDGVVHIHSIGKENKPKTINTHLTNINNILLMPNNDYVMVSGESNKLAIIELSSAKLVSNDYLHFDVNIEHILLDAYDNLLIVLQNNTIYKFELPNAEELKSHILHNTLDEAFKLVEDDPMLRGTREHKRLEVMYEKLYTQAIEALIHSQTREAYRLTEMFQDVKSKKDEIRSIFKDFENYSRFKTLVIEKKFALAYVMSEKFPSLKRTLQFKKMEESFRDAFSFAQKQILIGREDIARELLTPYASVIAKKPIINLLLKQNKDFIDFLKAIQTKNYILIEKLLGKNELFAQIPTYTALRLSEQNSLDAIAKLINNSKIKEAVEEIKALQNTPGIKEELKELYRVAKLVESLHLSYKEGDFTQCYEIIDTHYVLNELQLSALLEKHWAKLMGECEEFALKGDIKSIKDRLGELIGVKTRLAKVGDLLRVSFHSKIKGLLAKRSFLNAENIIYSYIDIFGIDSELISLMKVHEKLTEKKLAITLHQERLVPRDNWTRSPLIMTPSTLQ